MLSIRKMRPAFFPTSLGADEDFGAASEAFSAAFSGDFFLDGKASVYQEERRDSGDQAMRRG
jgi:hypothetical protein